MFRFALIASLVFAGYAGTAFAESPSPGSGPQLSPEAIAKAMAPAERRLTTLERWRGKPYLKRDVEQPAPRLRAAELEPLRADALDRALPPLRAIVGGF